MTNSFATTIVLFFTLFHLCVSDRNIIKQENIFTVIVEETFGKVSVVNNDSSTVAVVSEFGTTFSLICESSCPVEWKLETYQFKKFPDNTKDIIQFKTTRSIVDFYNTSTYKFGAEIHFVGSSNQVTGNYFCACTDKSTTSFSPIGIHNTSVYIYRFGEASSGSHLLQAGEDQKVYRQLDSPWVRIICGVSNPNQTVHLFKVDEIPPLNNDHKTTPVLMSLNNSSLIRDMNGFLLNVEKVESPFGNYLCASTTNLSSRDSSGLGFPVAKIEILNKFDTKPEKIIVTISDKVAEQSKNILFYNSKNNEVACCRQNKDQEHEQLGFFCENPQECAFSVHRIRGHFKNANEENDTCSSYTAGKLQSKGGAILRCLVVDNKTNRDLIEVYGEFFFSLHSDQYFSLEEVVLNSLIEFNVQMNNRDNRTQQYLGERLSFECKRPNYPFSKGAVWGLKKYDGSIIFVNKNEISKRNFDYTVEDGDKMQNNETGINLRIYNENVKSVLCHFPLWNSHEWAVAEISLNLSNSKLPKIEGEKEKTIQVYSGDKFVDADCKATGIPTPHLIWTKNSESLDSNTASREKSNGEYVTNTLKIAVEDMDMDLDSYECNAFNIIGEDRQRFRIKFKESQTATILGITTGVLFVGIVVSILLWKIIVQRKELEYLTKAEIEEFELGKPEVLANWSGDINGCTHLLPYNNAYEIPRGTLFVDEKKILGQGTYGVVMKGIIKKGSCEERVVAVKTIKPNEEMMHFKILLSELKIMAFIGSHQYIVSLVGAYSRNIRNRELLVAIEFCENGSLQDYLRKFRNTFQDLFGLPIPNEFYYVNGEIIRKHEEPLDSKQLLQWSLEIVTGMEFLASKKVIHGDLAARNILITAQRTAKIGDFGLSKHLFEYSTYVKKTSVLLPWKWMALESLIDMEFSVQSDTWAFGITLWEIFSLGQVPYPGVPWNSEFLDKLRGSYRLQQPKYSSTQIYEIMLNCWNHQPHDRPKFTQLRRNFMEILSGLSTLK